MDISPACQPPIQPPISAADRAHPRFAEYQRYRAGMSAQLVTADAFPLWLRTIEENERSFDHVFQTKPGATLAQGWYKHRFGPGHKLLARLGPFATRAEAEAAR